MSKTISSDNRQRRLRKSVLLQNKANHSKMTNTSMDIDDADLNISSQTTSVKKTSKLSDALKAELINSPDAAVEIIYPLLGKIVKKYLKHKFDEIKRSFKVFSLRSISNTSNGEGQIDYVLDEAKQAEIAKVIMFEKASGKVLSEFSNSLAINDNTERKIHDAIGKSISAQLNNNEIECLKVKSYTIHIQLISNYVFAVIISEPYNWSFKGLIEYYIIDFVQRKMTISDLEDKNSLTRKLIKHFRKIDLTQ